MEATGGKYILYGFIYALICIIFEACDSSKMLEINKSKIYILDAECGSMHLTCSRFADAIIIGQKYYGTFTLHPNSLKIGFHPQSIKMENVRFDKINKEIKPDESIDIENESIGFRFRICSDISYDPDTAMMFILPCDYIKCNGKSLISDTIRINLKIK